MIVAALGHHAVSLLLLQLALLLVVARVCALLARAAGLPSVVGELSAGIVLGPSVLGHLAPGLSMAIFPRTAEHLDLLDVVGTLGMVLLLLLTGIETDLRLLRNLGRPALVASIMGMAVPFGMGFALGLFVPDAYLAQPDRRVLFSAFIATAMAISAMPVIAKILMDLGLTRRNLGLVILSAGVVDDTVGWLILSVIAGAATRGGGVEFGGTLLALVWTGAFLVGAAVVLYPVLRWLLRIAATRIRAPDTDLALIVAAALLCAAVTEHIGVHAVFGAFVCGTVLGQVRHLSHETVRRLESFVFTILAPVFFGIVGLKVDLWALAGGGAGAMLGLVLAVACLGKLVGCTLGSLMGGLRFWESLSIAVAMNARGAMELVVATIGLSLGILNPVMFSIIVVVAIVTSFMAPVLLRLTVPMVKMSDEEARRLRVEASKGALDPAHLHVLVPTAGGPNAFEATRIGLALARHSDAPVEVMFVDARPSWRERFVRPIRKTQAGKDLEPHLRELRALAGEAPLRVRTVVGRSVSKAILGEAARGVDLMLVGAMGQGADLGGPVIEELVADAPCHVGIVRAGTTVGGSYARVLALADGSLFARVAVEVALRYAEAAGATLDLVLLEEPGSEHLPARTDEEALSRVSPVFQASDVKARIVRIAHDPEHTGLLHTIHEGGYDLLVLGAENRAIQNQLFFGHDTQRLVENASVTLVVVVPALAKLR